MCAAAAEQSSPRLLPNRQHLLPVAEQKEAVTGLPQAPSVLNLLVSERAAGYGVKILLQLFTFTLLLITFPLSF